MYLESRNLCRFLESGYLHRYLESRNLHKFVESRKHMIRGTYYRQLHLIQLMSIEAALPVDRRKAQFFITSLLLQVQLLSIPTVFASLQARAIARWFLCLAAIRGRATILAFDSQGMVLQSLQRLVHNASGSKFHTHFRANI